MTKAKKGLIITLFAAMMVFAFGATSAFADTPDGVYTGVTWASDFHSANVNVKYYDEDTEATVTETLSFDYYDKTLNDEGLMPATKADVKQFDKDGQYGLFVIPATDSITPVKYTLAACKPYQNIDGECYWYPEEDMVTVYPDGKMALTVYEEEGNNPVAVRIFYPEKNAVAKELQKVVYDAYYTAGMNQASYNAKVLAGVYSAWYATKDDKYPAEDNPAEVTMFGGWYDDTLEDFATITYPEYNAYEFDTTETGKKVDKTLAITVALNEAAIKAEEGSSVNVSTATGTLEFVPQVKSVNDTWYYTDWNIAGATDVFDEDFDYHGYLTYDGASHGFELANVPKEVTYQYYIDKADADGDYAKANESKIADSEWSDTFAGLKDAGAYHVYVKFTTTKNNASVVQVGAVLVKKMPVFVGFKQEGLRTEYGKYNRESLEAAVKELVVYSKTPDSADKVAEAVTKYGTVYGLFTDAGFNTLTAPIDKDALDKDKELAAALTNYKFVAGTDCAKDGVIGEMKLTIEKAENIVTVKTSKKSYSAKALKKAKKTFTVKTEADFGEVILTKDSGSSKLTLKDGKITVKKGTKKGKYKIVVQARVKGTANYASALTYKTITVKVK
jgi:hypothetical protein